MNPLALTITPTSDLLIHHGAECRLWVGVNTEGFRVKVLVALVAVDERADQKPVVEAIVELPAPPVLTRAVEGA